METSGGYWKGVIEPCGANENQTGEAFWGSKGEGQRDACAHGNAPYDGALDIQSVKEHRQVLSKLRERDSRGIQARFGLSVAATLERDHSPTGKLPARAEGLCDVGTQPC